MKRDRTVASGSTIEGGGTMLVSSSRVPKTEGGTGDCDAIGMNGTWTRVPFPATLVLLALDLFLVRRHLDPTGPAD